MNKLDWCLKQKRGVQLIEPNSDLSESYVQESSGDLDMCLSIKGKWQVISGYYACYNFIYALLMKAGIKSEIHDCSIVLMDLFDYSQEDIDLIEKLKDLRIKNQYYLQKFELENLDEIKKFILKSKKLLLSLNEEKIIFIRKKIMLEKKS